MLLALLPFAVAAQADLTVKGENFVAEGDSDDFRPEGEFTLSIKDDQMRTDSSDGQVSMLIRPAADGTHEYVFLDHAERKAMIMPREMAGRAEPVTSATTDNFVRPVGTDENGLLRVEYGYVGSASLPGGVGGGEIPAELKDMIAVVMEVQGIAMVEPEAEGSEELVEFSRMLASGMGNVEGSSGLTQGLATSMLHVAAHGMPMETQTTTEIRIRVNAEGPMRGMIESMANRMPNMKSRSRSVVHEVSTDSVDASLFYDGGFPEGYAVETMQLP